MALFRLFFNIFPVLTSLSFAKSFFLNGVEDDECNNNKINDSGKLTNGSAMSKAKCFQQTMDNNDDNLVKLCGQLKKILDLPAVLFTIILVQMISFVLVLNIEECSPLVLFSWWRNKIS